MMKIGYQPGKGLGAALQGRTELVSDKQKGDKYGLGYKEWIRPWANVVAT
ncbi:hypothetical protein, partial [Klebsiella pneumoniae]